ncbi:hypothetical protein H6G20_07395 [Desertifilum sp. FACHB-1129]|uniref:Uncharacterized protein n=2 Tax=Desertifilum tharense IPPAS B-1220 TaxID=1781255 RepID=A0ACD5GZ26_9CYAN|nr:MULTISPECIES: hypothetical protein [Desertifilum]MBD2311481.1 hypothetical protein [Desertifilum sp. FACHB-1129]MBD2323055.1 hypothetical protein [Desertifilum sp. FACHB-866]MBD2332900.1 hypothetical protein [Desertifilum sp. FACHB-868]MDA0210481.1 hypothetical protein [Cyanobacteria bacterium FC1]
MASPIGGRAMMLDMLAIADQFQVKGLIEYMRQNAQKRAEYYTSMRERFKENDRFQELFEMLDNDDPELAELPYHKKLDFLGFYEDIALMVNSGLLKKPVAHYMFAYYAIRCWESNNFWDNLNRDSPYWFLFRDFVNQMQKVEKSLMQKPHPIRRYKL